MLKKFYKMHGIGNDYIYFDCLQEELENPEELSIRLSDRHTGIGGDGIVMICKSEVADAKMRMFNADGSEGMMCGNAIRCVGKFLYDFDKVKKTTIAIETLSGIKTLQLTVKGGKVTEVEVDMGAPILEGKSIPTTIERDEIVAYPYNFIGDYEEITCVSMGNPHCIIFKAPDELDLEKIGPKYENAPIFPKRVNTEFVKVLKKNELKMRVWERGSGETRACGTGACAVAVAAVLNGYAERNKEITVHLLGGDLSIRWTDETVSMKGSATLAFTGEVEI
ncbi:MAG: diaminopimelate epimerase [Clostridia bacterium]|nr:diaminopimelate epimerase [Clostridia bacterium]